MSEGIGPSQEKGLAMTTATSTYELQKEILSIGHSLNVMCGIIREHKSAAWDERLSGNNEVTLDTIKAYENAWTACFDAVGALLDLSSKL